MAEIVTTDNIRKNANTEPVPADQPVAMTNDLRVGESTTVPVEAQVATATESESSIMKSDFARMRDYFASRPKVTVYIPENADEHVMINGYAFHLKAGEEVEVPVDVADVLRTSWKGRGTANQRRQIETQSF